MTRRSRPPPRNTELCPGGSDSARGSGTACGFNQRGRGHSKPVPLINQPLVPEATRPGGAAFTLTVNGTGFTSGSVVQWNGNPRATTFVSRSQLKATIVSSDIAKAETASVTVVNPGRGGSTSNVGFFEVTTPSASIALNKSEFGNSGNTATWLSTADFNRDGKLDLAVAEFKHEQCHGAFGKRPRHVSSRCELCRRGSSPIRGGGRS